MTGKKEPRPSIFIRLPPELHQELIKAANERDISMNRLAVEAFKDFLPRLKPVSELKLTKD